ncbi:MAG: hypothetical protein WDN76_05690 [Alphaproteobacteria bacterium]
MHTEKEVRYDPQTGEKIVTKDVVSDRPVERIVERPTIIKKRAGFGTWLGGPDRWRCDHRPVASPSSLISKAPIPPPAPWSTKRWPTLSRRPKTQPNRLATPRKPREIRSTPPQITRLEFTGAIPLPYARANSRAPTPIGARIVFLLLARHSGGLGGLNGRNS